MVAAKAASPKGARALMGDGAFGGDYEKDDDTMLALWAVGVSEVRAALEGPWPNPS